MGNLTSIQTKNNLKPCKGWAISEEMFQEFEQEKKERESEEIRLKKEREIEEKNQIEVYTRTTGEKVFCKEDEEEFDIMEKKFICQDDSNNDWKKYSRHTIVNVNWGKCTARRLEKDKKFKSYLVYDESVNNIEKRRDRLSSLIDKKIKNISEERKKQLIDYLQDKDPYYISAEIEMENNWFKKLEKMSIDDRKVYEKIKSNILSKKWDELSIVEKILYPSVINCGATPG